MAAQMPVGPSRVRLPDPASFDFSKPEDLRAWAEQTNQAIAMALQQRPAQTQPRAEMLLSAPNGDSYALTVDNAGALTAVLRNKVSA